MLVLHHQFPLLNFILFPFFFKFMNFKNPAQTVLYLITAFYIVRLKCILQSELYKFWNKCENSVIITKVKWLFKFWIFELWLADQIWEGILQWLYNTLHLFLQSFCIFLKLALQKKKEKKKEQVEFDFPSFSTKTFNTFLPLQ